MPAGGGAGDENRSIRNGRVQRQRPVSCNFCRSRKLRCSRTSPCTNCSSRGIPCRLDLPVPTPATPATSDGTVQSILRRLQLLEQLVLSQDKANPTLEATSRISTVQPLHDLSIGSPESSDAAFRAPELPSYVDSPTLLSLQSIREDVTWLEKESMSQNSVVRGISGLFTPP